MQREITGVSTKDALRLWLRLLSLTNMVEGRLRRNLRAHYGVTLPRFDVMAALYDKEPAGASMGDIAQRLLVTNGNVTGIVERLEREGLVRRRQRPEDRRSYIVRLTEEGRRSFEAMAKDLEGWVATMFAGLDEEEIGHLAELLGKAKRSVRSTAGEEG
ncbi:transcriptional regulator, MarR family [Rubrobacter xylanophilus DSM 9941]|uniref:Transcriptional regulator, MarR family n=1 Tax=Rubrobacter xylanophilus (strain DSM 9941 / JCM 11954 / NBRC 16129 / PRD-1) TaxID=266117 RepID=Q1ATS2_RUBXD|nr:MarR family transcriptional regulator [Rubrobacter xylanophilus]ABG05206.1 transcriptional regulator, MarR family [Rubrobacter xylanophilus DSM 9941]